MTVELTISSTPRCTVVINELPATIGRGPEADVRLGDDCVSRRHCEIEEIGGTLLVHDLGSKNGTFVNGVFVEEAPVLPGDRLTIGRTPLLVRYHRPPETHHQRDPAEMTGGQSR